MGNDGLPMRACLTAILSVVLPAWLAAQTPKVGEPAAASPAASLGAVPAGPAIINLALGGDAAQQPQAPPPPSPTVRRRGSMVGYIDDASIESRVRVRFDAAFGNTAPDRAEFFYAKCGCYGELDPAEPAYDPDAPGPPLGAANDVQFQQLNVWGEYAMGSVVSVFGQFPVRWLQPQSFLPNTGPGFTNESGIGDLRAGAKIGFAPAIDHMLTAQVQFYFPTGDPAKGMGTDHVSFEPAILYQVHAAETVTIESQFGVWLPFGGSAGVPTSVDGNFSGRILNYGVGAGFDLVRRGNIQVGPVVELAGWRVLNGYETGVEGELAGTNIVNLKIGGRFSFDGRNSLYFGYGFALTEATWYDDILRFEYRYGF